MDKADRVTIDSCPFCEGDVRVKMLECLECGTGFEGTFETSNIVGLTLEQQRFIEQFVLCSGSLKEMADIEDVTYPTIRNRLDKIIDALERQNQRDRKKEEVLEKLEQEEITTEEAIELLQTHA